MIYLFKGYKTDKRVEEQVKILQNIKEMSCTIEGQKGIFTIPNVTTRIQLCRNCLLSTQRGSHGFKTRLHS